MRLPEESGSIPIPIIGSEVVCLYADAGSSGRACLSAGTNTSGKGFGASWSGATAYEKHIMDLAMSGKW